jgi:hypothetical protein
LHGASRVFFFLEEGCGGLLPVLLAAGSCSECWRVERERGETAARWSATARPRRQPPRPKKDGEARRGSFPRPSGSAGTSRKPAAIGATRGRRRATTERAPAPGAAPGSAKRTGSRQAPDRQHPRQRQLFRFSRLSNNRAASGTCNRPGIAQFHGTAFHETYRREGSDLSQIQIRPLSIETRLREA